MSYPLEGVRVLELGQIIAGTYGSQVLSDMGAEVIKVESPEGDLGRNPSIATYRGVSALFLTLNRNKQSIVIDLKTEAGRKVFYELVKVSDVVIDNFRPGVLERLQIDYETLSRINPRIIHCSVTGFGRRGRLQGLSGARHHHPGDQRPHGDHRRAGRPPARVGIPLADLSGGIFSCKGILAALFDRERTGKGRRVELSMFDAMLNLMSYMGTMWLTAGELPEPQGNAHEFGSVAGLRTPRRATSSSPRGRRCSGASCAPCWRGRVWRTIRAMPPTQTRRKPCRTRAAARAHLPYRDRGALAGAPACRRRARGAGQQSRPRVRRAAGGGTRDDRRIRPPRRRHSAPAGKSDQDLGRARHHLQAGAAARTAHRRRARQSARIIGRADRRLREAGAVE